VASKVSGKKPLPKKQRKSRARFLPISAEMKEWSAMLASELKSLPGITTKPMFGFLSFYRDGEIFAALPQTRGFSGPASLIFKFNPMPPGLQMRAHGDPRMDTSTRIPGKGWFVFELASEGDVHEALFWLNQAYEAAAK